MKTTNTNRTLKAVLALAVLLPVLLAAGATLADDDEHLDAGRAALNERAYRQAAALFAEAREQAENERTEAEALYWEAFARYRTEKTHELVESLELLRLHADRYEDAATAAEAEALAARVAGELGRRGKSIEARETYENAEKERQREETRIAALHALVQMDSDKALPILEKIVKGQQEASHELRQTALFMLCQTDDDGVEILLDVLPTLKDADLLQTAVICLSQSNIDRAHRALVDMARTSDDPEVLQAVMISLGQSSHREEAFELLSDMARDKSRDEEVRSHAIIGLMQADIPGTADVLLSIIRDRDEDEEVLEAALMGLAQLDDTAATEALMDMATDSALDDEMRAQALFMAGIHGHIEAGELREIYEAAESAELKVQVCHVLTQIDDQGEAFDVMMSILEKETDPDVRGEAVFWIGQFDDPRAAEYLLKVINDE
ncbi:MAG: HEAT repeat domain-containing protein [bacterium]|nr:HEAT repeat domain-containing protein [bacterium]